MKRLLLLIPLVVLLLASSTQAAQWQANDTVLINATSTDDVYAAGSSVSIQSPITGDVYAAGGDVILNQTVSQDVVLVGGTVTLLEQVADDARLAGGTVIVNSPVADDLLIFGGSVSINSDIGGDLVVIGGQVIINGNVAGAMKIMAGSVTLNGTYSGPTEIRAEDININGTFMYPSRLAASELLFIQEGSVFNASLEYYQPAGEMDFSPFLQNDADATFQPTLKPQEPSAKDWNALASKAMGWFALMTLLSALLVIGLIVGLGGNYIWQIADDVKQNFWSRFGAGLLFFVATPIIALILMVTIIGLPLGLAALAGFIVSMLFTKTLTATVLAAWIIRRSHKQWTGWRLWLVAVGIYVLLRIVSYIPVIGWLATMLVVCATFGALIKLKWTNFRRGAVKNS